MEKLAKLPEVAECYDPWNRPWDELERYCKDTLRGHKPLSQQKEFKDINKVIREAEAYLRAKEILLEYKNPEEDKAEQVKVLERLWDTGFIMAAHHMEYSVQEISY